jgi:hypothetical protein
VRRLLGILPLVALGACTGGETTPQPDPSAVPGHDHGSARVSLAVGDGTERYDVGYTLADVVLPDRVGEPGELSFRIDGFRKTVQTRFLTEQTKKMHVYVVRDDLAVFRHVHPEMDDDGTWRGTLTLPEPGDYRLVAEFVARDEGGNGDHVLLGARVEVAGDWQPVPAPDATGEGGDWGVEADVLTPLRAGDQQQLTIRLTRPDGAPPSLGQYLGTSAHLTGFHTGTGGAVHMHPLGAPVPDDRGDAPGLDLDFHAEMPEAGTYVLFLQVRVDDFLHTLPIPVEVAA